MSNLKIIITIFLIPYCYAGSIQASSFAILPVLSERVESKYITKGPKIFLNQEKNNWELARLIWTLLSVGEFHQLANMDTIKIGYTKLSLNSKRSLSIDLLSALGREIDAEKMLVSFLQREGNVYVFTTRVFYTSSQNLTDTIQTTSNDLWDLINKHLGERFPTYKQNFFILNRQNKTLLFLLDTSGSNYKEISVLTKMIEQNESFNTGICTLSGSGRVSFLKPGLNKETVLHFLSQIAPRGGSERLKNLFKALNCLEKILPPPDINNTIKIAILMSSAPKDEQEKRRVKLILRKFARRANILVVGSSDLSPPDRNFWQEVVQELSKEKQHTYKDLLYRQKLGLANGDEIYVLKKGNQLLQSTSQDIIKDPDFVINIPPEYWSILGPKNIKLLYRKLSENEVIESDEIEILMQETILDEIHHSGIKGNKNIQQIVKLLIEMESGKFWLSLPKKTIYTKQGLIKIQKEGSYYFMLNMKPGSQGIPFLNDPNFGVIYEDFSNLPRILLLNLDDYLKNSKRYLGHSIGGSSLYIFFAKVRAIKLNDKK